MRLQIKELQRSVGTTALYVTHDQVEAMTLADRLIVMNAGVAEQIDAPMRIYEQPATVFVAGFIGSPAMNIVPATVSDNCDAVVLSGGPAVRLPDAGLATAGAPVLFGIRPEHLAVAPPGDDVDRIPLVVHAVETLGADAFAHCYFPQAATGEGLVVRLPGTASLKPRERISVSADPTAAHLFDVASRRRLGA
jgi:sn-glycerol 3-phosphate transport system ATP-binding protein